VSAELAGRLGVLAEVVRRFGLTSLSSLLEACTALSGEAPLDVAVLGQFKSGKSSLLNAVLGTAVFPVGVLPVTAVVTRVAAGPAPQVRVTHLDGSSEDIAADRLAEFVTEAGNPGNRLQVTTVDVFTPALRDWPGVRLVDTPGLGSVFAHNTEATRAWMPHAAVALVTVSAERPLSDEDRRLVAEARQTAPRVAVVLTKVDLLTEAELQEVTAFVEGSLRNSRVPVLPFSCRVEREQHVRRLQEALLFPIARDVAGERQAALGLKTGKLVQACRDYLQVGLQAAERADADRERLRAAVFNESVRAAVIHDELRLAEQSVCAGTRPAFALLLLAEQEVLDRRLSAALATELPDWTGNLAQQTERYESWMAQRLTAELAPLSRNAAGVGTRLLEQAEERFRRVVEAFRDRLSRNIREATGVTIAPLAWEARQPQVAVIPVAVSRAFMTNWDLLWWLLPMWLVGGLFRRHVLGRVTWEATKNLTRLASDWTAAVNTAIGDLRAQAARWVDSELATLESLLGQRPADACVFREALEQLDSPTHRR
jgi:GTP-binding protein EngB required for normal cell division